MSQLFLYINTNKINLLLDSSGSVENQVLYNKDMIVNKRVDNTINFYVKDQDRKTFRILDKILTVHIQKRDTTETVSVKQLEVIDEDKAHFQLKLSAGDIDGWEPGFYKAVITVTDLEGWEETLYTGTQYNPIFELEVRDVIFDPFRPSTISTPSTWGFDGGLNWFVSSAYSADHLRGFTEGLHTLAVYADNFCGKFWVQATLDDTVPADNRDWFNIKIDLLNDYHRFGIEPDPIPPGFNEELNLLPETKVEPFNFQMGCQWVRFAYRPFSSNTGKLTQVLFSN